ncbi:MAG: 3-phosphoshikimate 1-carboxyvinyltransferase [Phycisphaerales bacterium]|jgi:3-phosphoshikimate 1-carboxyvinyltransferase|nr:3-phosphoshikimate 1-carboxyvinyltransferase [Phycisphaerales bacterium]
MSDLTILPLAGPFKATIRPPGSKSLTNRALVLAALARGTSTLNNVLFADDTLVMLDGLKKLGVELRVDQPAGQIEVQGTGGEFRASNAELFCGNSGTTIRFLSAVCALGHGSFTLDGIARMRQRPIGQLVELLRNVGVRVEYPLMDGFPPIQIDAAGLPGGNLRFGAAQSSQFLSALLQVSPYARHEIRVDLEPNQTSWPYVAMTMRLMDHFDLTPELIRDPQTGEPKQIIIPRGHYRGTAYAVEPDASSASYFLAAAALWPGATITIAGLGKNSLQGDVGFADVLKKMGAVMSMESDSITLTGPELLEGIDIDLRDMPDTAQTLAVVCLFAQGQSKLHGLHTLRHKETDRLAALSNELTKLGAGVRIDQDTLIIDPPQTITPATIATYDDHRMAMSFALVGTRIPGVTIQNIECVNKTYPNYFSDLNILRETTISP